MITGAGNFPYSNSTAFAKSKLKSNNVSESFSSDWSQNLRSALSHHQAGRLEQAESLYFSVLQNQPRQHDALRLLGVLCRQRGELPKAREYLGRALEVRPDSAEAHHDLGLALYDEKEFAEAARLYSRALELKPQFPEALHNLGNAYTALWRLEDATRSFEQALEQAPGLEEPRLSLEWIRKVDSEIAAIAEYHRQALNGSPPAAVAATPSNRGELSSRDLLPHLLNKLGLTGAGAEVGVQTGEFSDHLLRHWKGERLYSIDPWREFPSADYLDIANVPQSQHDELYRTTIKRLMPFVARSVIWRLTSKEAAGLLPRESLDFCYLDGDHSYQAVVEDISFWYPTLKKGGLLAGHDLIPDGTYHFGKFGVQGAVHELVRTRGLKLFTTGEPKFASWFVLKTA